MTTSSKNTKRNIKSAPLPPRGTLDPELQRALTSKNNDTQWNDDLSELPPIPKDDETLVIMHPPKK